MHAPEGAVVCVDVGNNAYSLGRYFQCTRQSFLMSAYLGSIGYALPAAMGAWAATRGERAVIAVAGDGGLAQYLAEWTTVVKYGMAVKLVLLNNNEFAKISKEQHASGLPAWKTDLVNPDFAAFARGCGSEGTKVERREELDQAMRKLFAVEGPALLEIVSDPMLV